MFCISIQGLSRACILHIVSFNTSLEWYGSFDLVLVGTVFLRVGCQGRLSYHHVMLWPLWLTSPHRVFNFYKMCSPIPWNLEKMLGDLSGSQGSQHFLRGSKSSQGISKASLDIFQLFYALVETFCIVDRICYNIPIHLDLWFESVTLFWGYYLCHDIHRQ